MALTQLKNYPATDAATRAQRTAEYREAPQPPARSLCGIHERASLTTLLNETLRSASALQEMQKSEHHHQSGHGKSGAGARRVRRNIWRAIRLHVAKMADADHGSVVSCSLPVAACAPAVQWMDIESNDGMDGKRRQV